MHETIDMKVSWQEMNQFPKDRILVIGDGVNPPLQYIDMLLKLRYEIVWVGKTTENACPTITVNIDRYDPKILLYPELGTKIANEFPFSLQGLLDFINMDFSMILHFQNHWFPIDKKKSPIPYIYIPSETWNPKVPFCATATTYCNIVMREMIEKYHPNIPIIGFLPYPVSLAFNLVKPTSKYTHLIGFCGKLDTFEELYEERRNICFEMKKRFPNDFVGHWPASHNVNIPPFSLEGKGTLQMNEYSQFLQDGLFGLSIPTSLGLPFRDLEVAAVGKCLVTKKTRDHATLGFEEDLHYLAYSNIDELTEILKHTSKEDALRIGMNSYRVIQKSHLSYHRIPLLEMIFEKFGILPHAKTLGFWKINSETKNYVEVWVKSGTEDLKNSTELYIGKDIYYPVGVKYDR